MEREGVAGRSIVIDPLVTPPGEGRGEKPTRRAFGPLAEAHRGRRKLKVRTLLSESGVFGAGSLATTASMEWTLQTPHRPVNFFLTSDEKPGFCSGFEAAGRGVSPQRDLPPPSQSVGAPPRHPPLPRLTRHLGETTRGVSLSAHAPRLRHKPCSTRARPPSSPQAPASASRARPAPPDGGSCPKPSSPRRGSSDRRRAPRG